MIQLLKWFAGFDIQHYKTTSNSNYAPTDDYHFYLKGSDVRFTAKDLVDIYEDTMNKELKNKWNKSLLSYIEYLKNERKM